MESDNKISEEDIDKFKLIIEEWKVVIQTQMHFNEMIMKMRTTSISIFLAIFGAAAISLQYSMKLTILNFKFHASVLIIIVGIIMLISVFIIDYCYYDRMLRGAVEKSYKIDNAFKDVKILDTSLFGLSTSIRNGIGETEASKKYIKLFYCLPIIIGIIFIIAILCGYQDMSAISTQNSTVNSTITRIG